MTSRAYRVVGRIALTVPFYITVDAENAQQAEEYAWDEAGAALENGELNFNDAMMEDFSVYEVESVLE